MTTHSQPLIARPASRARQAIAQPTRGNGQLSVQPHGREASELPRVAFVSTYPPTTCGLASFTTSLRRAMATARGTDNGLCVTRVTDESDPGPIMPSAAVWGLVNPADRYSVSAAARRLSQFDAVILQHEYGIYGPASGRSVLDLVDQTDAPVITTLHTVLTQPTDLQQLIMRRLVDSCDRAVVLTTAAQRLLAEGYDVDDAVVIPHGTDVVRIAPGGARRAGTADRGPTLLTWGLIGPGKGLEWAIAAVHLLRDRFPGIRYVIAGRTHPKVQDSHGEDYRRSLEEIVERLGLEDAVEFIDDYLPRPALHKLLGSTDAVVLPYDSTEQVVSGVLTEAIAASVPVVATEFPHAVELAEADAVVTAPHQRPDAIAQALTDLFDAPNQMERMRDAQRRLAPDLEWSSVAARYEALVRSVLKRPVALDA